jgi:hypothetical protein
MKKIILAAAIIFSVALSSCTKENVAPTSAPKSFKLATGDKGNLSQADFTGDSTSTAMSYTGDKGNLSQADFTTGDH